MYHLKKREDESNHIVVATTESILVTMVLKPLYLDHKHVTLKPKNPFY